MNVLFQSAIVVITSDSAQIVRILELTLRDEGDVTTIVNGEIHFRYTLSGGHYLAKDIYIHPSCTI